MNQLNKEDNTKEISKEEVKPELSLKSDIPTPESAEKKEADTPEQVNWKKFRETREKDRVEQQKQIEEANRKTKEAQAQAQALKEAMDSYLNKESNAPVSNDIDDDDISSKDMPTGSEIASYTKQQIKKGIAKGLELQRMEQQKAKQERDQNELPRKLKESHANFDEVCSTENLDYLEFHYPEVAVAYSKMPNDFSKWSNIYKAIKRFVPNTDGRDDKIKMNKNSNAPQSVSSISPDVGEGSSNNTPSSKKEQNWSRMQRIMKGL